MALMALLVDYGGVLTDLGDDPTTNEPPLVGVVRRAREAGVRTALVSNTGGATVTSEWRDLFDRVVTSGDVGIAKPDPEFYLTAARALGVEPSGCVVVDDLRHNVEGAVEAGMVGVHHHDVRTTLEELVVLLGADIGGS